MKIEELAKLLAEQGIKQADLLVNSEEFQKLRCIGVPSESITVDSRGIADNPKDVFMIQAYGVRVSFREHEDNLMTVKK